MTLVGRDTELAQLRDTARQARDGRGRLVVLSGDAGLGKSALVEQLASELEASFDVTWGRAWELADAPAYFPLWPCLKSLGIRVDATQVDVRTFELWEQVLEALVRASEIKPVMWIVEDLHVADTQTLDLLTFLGQAVRGLRVVIVTTTRPVDNKRVVRLAREGREIRLAPLPAAAVAALATQWLGRELTATESARLAERTGGNPLFVVECARAGSRVLDAVPSTVAVVVGERIDQLPDVARRLVCDAAVIGNEVTAATLGAMNDQLPARVIDDIGPALRSGLLEELAPGRYKFSHALVRDAIETHLTAPARVDAHTRAYRALAQHPDSPKLAVERARHALATLAPGSEAMVLAAVQHALDMLEQQGTYDRAAALCAQLHALRADGQLPPATHGELLRAARLSLAAGRFAESRQLCIEAAVLARAAGDAEAFAAATLALGADTHPGLIVPEVVRHLEEARTMLGDQPSPTRCRVMARLAAALQPAPDPRIPVAMARTAIVEARASGDRALLTDVLFVAISAMTDMVDAAELRELNLEHLALVRETDDVAHTVRAYVRLALAELELGNLAAFEAHIEEMQRLASSVGHPRLTWRVHLMLSMRAIARGQFAESERYLAEVERAAQLTDDPSLPLSLSGHKHHRSLDQHREKTVADALTQLDAAIGPLPIAPILIPLLRAFAGARFGDAPTVARALAGFPLEQTLNRAPSLGHLGLLGEAYATDGTREQRTLLRDRLAPLVDRHIIFGHTPMTYAGPVQRVLGLLERALGNHALGEAHLRKALDTCRAHGFATWVARISFELGELDEAQRLATNLGIRGLARRANASDSDVAVAPATRPALGIAKEGTTWRISYGVRVVRVPDTRGMELIAKLIERPGEEIHALVLAGTGGDSMSDSDAGAALDERAARTYRDRLAAIDDELATARPDRAIALERERDFLLKELARAFGLANAPRKIGSMSERARVNVQRRIKDSLARIGQQDSVIADYLRSAIRTGTYCMFRP